MSRGSWMVSIDEGPDLSDPQEWPKVQPTVGRPEDVAELLTGGVEDESDLEPVTEIEEPGRLAD